MKKGLFSVISGLFAKREQRKTAAPAKSLPVAPTPTIVPIPAPASKPIFKPEPQRQQSSLEQKRLLELLGELRERENKLGRSLRSLEEREKFFQERERLSAAKETQIQKKEAALESLRHKEEEKLIQISGLKKEEAQKKVMELTEKRLAVWLAKKIEETKEAIEARETELAQEILLDAIKHGVVNWVAEYTVSSIHLPDEETKGKIIGRSGRNIRTFEKATGVELEFDETLDVRLSSFDSVRREVAKIALQKLLRDGRIQPARIEEVVEQTKGEMERILIEEGNKICQYVGVYHLPIELIKIIGRFKFRFSYGQNLAQHTIEETKIGVALAQELGADTKIVRLGCLLHDIGKVITEEEGSHIQLGVDLLKQYRLPEKVIACVAEHHEDKPFSCVESTIVWIADAASGSRPGARYEAHEEYLKRMENVEKIVKSFEGVADVAAYQAGREVRVVVKPDEVSDEEMTVLSQKMAEKLEDEAKWAGQIKITLIRELRTSAFSPPIAESKNV